MKKSTTLTIIFVFSACVVSLAQSHSFQTLKNKFSGSANVHCFTTSGFFARTILWMAGEHDFNEAITEIKNIRLIVIPRSAFKEQSVTLSGFKKILKKDSFELLGHVSDHGDNVTLFMQTATSEKNNRYLLLVDNDQDVVAIEIKGYINPDILLKKDCDLAHVNN